MFKATPFVFICLLFSFLKISSKASAQDYLSPFSQYGLGDRQPQAFARYLGMGNTGAAAMDDNLFTLANPASYSLIHSFVFEGGINAAHYDLKSANQQYSYFDYNIPYVCMGLPSTDTSHKWGFSAGITPFSRVSYRLQEAQDTPIAALQQYTATGNTARVYLGTGFQLFKNFFIGANANYIFGNIQSGYEVQFPDSFDLSGVEKLTRTLVSDFYFDGGVLYLIKMKNAHSLHIGLSANMPKKLHTTYSTVINSLLPQRNRDGSVGYIFADSISQTGKKTGYEYLPMTTHIGINLNNSDSWHIFAAFHYSLWSQMNATFSNIWGGGIGGEWMPGEGSGKFAAFLGRIHYRAGISYQQGFSTDGLVIPSDIHLSLGFGVPVNKYRYHESNGTFIDLALSLGQTGNMKKNGVRQNYALLTFGIHLFEPQWFQRPKID